ncbi:hypothetical protein FDI24_gp192 [Acidovorax phage ACP17]|uniref:Uncharacterized protein n=1 Tax=Acidovorax phage ACP17 TaxID=2010329 RepID=A0A218M345_9CAUD|nr:hypothetical protein FDI24_gp192 [Acidovorax phage ACP17]ASD50474.1 hypothetical protein [Acidovorax phage ACP17]
MDELYANEDHLLSTIETVKECLAELLIEGQMITTDRVAVALAMVVQLEARVMMGFDDEESNMAPSIAILNKRLQEPPLEFEGIDPSVLSAVYSACDSAETNNLEDWEIDLIATRIVEAHNGQRKLAHNQEE